MPLGFIFLFDVAWWLVVILVAYGLILERKVFLRKMALPFALALALLCEGTTFQSSWFTPGVAAWRILYSGSPAYHTFVLGLAIVVDTACWAGIFFAAYKFVPRLRRIVK